MAVGLYTMTFLYKFWSSATPNVILTRTKFLFRHLHLSSFNSNASTLYAQTLHAHQQHPLSRRLSKEISVIVHQAFVDGQLVHNAAPKWCCRSRLNLLFTLLTVEKPKRTLPWVKQLGRYDGTPSHRESSSPEAFDSPTPSPPTPIWEAMANARKSAPKPDHQVHHSPLSNVVNPALPLRPGHRVPLGSLGNVINVINTTPPPPYENAAGDLPQNVIGEQLPFTKIPLRDRFPFVGRRLWLNFRVCP
jgi:hypothetical protein